MGMSPVSPPSCSQPHTVTTTEGVASVGRRGGMGAPGNAMAQGTDFPHFWRFHHTPLHSEGVTVKFHSSNKGLRLREVRWL